MELVFVAVFVVVAATALYQWHRKQQRREDIATWAFGQGMSYAHDDATGLCDLDFDLFSKGDGRGCDNVVAGRWHGLDVRLADYWYYDESTDSEGRTSRRYHRFSVVVIPVAAFLPGVRIEQENVLTRLADHVGLRDIEFESDAFNRRFNVKATDREFAFKLLDARMMEWLLRTAGSHCYEVSGPWLLAYCKPLPPAELTTLLLAAKGFLDRIPRLVWADYGKAVS